MISRNKKKYYAELSYASRYDIDITAWIEYFVHIIYQAQLESKQHIHFVLHRARFWHKYRNHLNERQQKVVETMFQAGSKGFKGGMSAQKYMKLTKCSKATATRDLSNLLQQGCFMRLPGSGRSTRYDIKFNN
ncbi:Fic family protein [Candidatus Paracaedibacter symbiosus]|uniref:Fic family protein n=1 Tax=Candidatus Paracaedibacter symbiosus TaxID=244582 RepID=UPI00068F659F|nr:Fic family protein [Candidatus Paracaedibacter symbiosus]